jgi:opacity protein-like surface antigen
MAAAAAGCAHAQNSDLGLLLGASVTHASVSSSRVSATNVSGGGQINYAIQMMETVAGRLYLELPLVIMGGVRATVEPGRVSSSVGTTFFFTPGARWKFTPASRVSLYAAAGGGLAAFHGVFSERGGNNVSGGVGGRTSGAFGFGAGLDFRLTRLVSLRGEYRDVMTRRSVDGSVHHSLIMFGVGLHF